MTSAVRARSLIIVTLLLLTTALLPMRASAHLKGDSWSYSSGQGLLTLSYDSDCANWTGIADAAANAWTFTWTPLWFSKIACNGNEHNAQVDIFTGMDSNLDHLAWEQSYTRDCFLWWCWWDPNSSDRIDSAIIHLNAFPGTFDSLPAADQQATVTHELGHALGLAHAGFAAGESSGGYSIMDLCCFDYNTPQAHDINDINSLYPGW